MAKYSIFNRTSALLRTLICYLMIAPLFMSFTPMRASESHPASYREQLADSIKRALRDVPGQVGVEVIINGEDTVAVNNQDIYPMMSVFKFHQAVALCREFDRRGLSLDSILTIRRAQLDTATWSPMLKDYREDVFQLSVRQLLRYSIIISDNNASNLLFERLAGTDRTDSIIATIIPRQSFRITYTEAQMTVDHNRAYSNHTSPLGAALLMERLFSDSLMSREKQEFIQKALNECATGKDRLTAPLTKIKGATIAHKTGTGYTTASGVLMAANDVAYISLPNGVHYTIAVFVKDFKGTEPEASKVIARLSAIVCNALNGQQP